MKKYVILTILFLSFFVATNVNAETGKVKSSDGINIREHPNTNSTVLKAIGNNVVFNIIKTNAGTGNGCSDNWYYIYYQNNYGYVCSSYVTLVSSTETSTSYGRPWTTPKKSIIGGAEFIAKDYIRIGQYTSYLMKFDVNPKHKPNFVHQYMENFRAPSTDASNTFKALNDNNYLDLPFNFVIPTYESMGDSTYDGTIINTERQTAGLQKQEFELSIANFPDSYKPYLRYLYTKHPSWTFTPLHTGYDFNEVVNIQKGKSSIHYESKRCEQPGIEKGFCRADTGLAKFYTDPRNFLSERYIFMFENLSFNQNLNESAVKAVLNPTFMKDISVLDNQSYSSIFMEAGRLHNVSPLYLASFARTESGVNGGLTTSGAEFEYEGYIYSGLYNFFNIGANSSATNPAKAGLVYANGGKGYNNGLDEPTINLISKLKLSSTGAYVKGYNLGTTIESIKNTAGSDSTVIIKNNQGSVKNNTDIIATGDSITITHNDVTKTFTYLLKGDINGDGLINSADLLSIRQHLLGIKNLSGVHLASARLTDNFNINSADLLRMRQYLLGMVSISQ